MSAMARWCIDCGVSPNKADPILSRLRGDAAEAREDALEYATKSDSFRPHTKTLT